MIAEDRKPPFKAAGMALQNDDGEYLFMRRSKKASDHIGAWAFPGGGREEGETSRQTAMRECMEETGYAPGRVEDRLFDNGDFITHFGRSPRFIPRMNEEHDDYLWSKELPEPAHPGLRPVFRDQAQDEDDIEGDKFNMDVELIEVIDYGGQTEKEIAPEGVKHTVHIYPE